MTRGPYFECMKFLSNMFLIKTKDGDALCQFLTEVCGHEDSPDFKLPDILIRTKGGYYGIGMVDRFNNVKTPAMRGFRGFQFYMNNKQFYIEGDIDAIKNRETFYLYTVYTKEIPNDE